MKSALAVLACLALAMPAAASDKPGERPEDVVCKTKRVKSLGSNMAGKRICRTRAQWAEIAAEARRELQSTSERALHPTSIPGAR